MTGAEVSALDVAFYIGLGILGGSLLIAFCIVGGAVAIEISDRRDRRRWMREHEAKRLAARQERAAQAAVVPPLKLRLIHPGACPTCHGNGWELLDEPCPSCGGTGQHAWPPVSLRAANGSAG